MFYFFRKLWFFCNNSFGIFKMIECCVFTSDVFFDSTLAFSTVYNWFLFDCCLLMYCALSMFSPRWLLFVCWTGWSYKVAMVTVMFSLLVVYSSGLCGGSHSADSERPVHSVPLWTQRSVSQPARCRFLRVRSRVLWWPVGWLSTRVCSELWLSVGSGLYQQQVPRPLSRCLWTQRRVSRQSPHSRLLLPPRTHWQSTCVL